MRNSVDVIIIGAGLVGAAAARALAARGRRVLMLRRGSGIGEASPAAAGMLAAQIESHDELMLPLALAARARHATLAAELRDAGHHVDHHADGILQLALTGEQAAALQATAAAQRRAGLEIQWLDAVRLAGLVPGLGEGVRGALLAAADGRVNNVALGKALERDAVKHGAMVEFAAAESLLLDRGRLRGVKSTAGERIAPVVLLAAGAWSPQIRGLPRPLPLKPVRGQMLRLSWPAAFPRQVLFGPSAYIVPRAQDAIIGSTMEDAGYDAHTTPDAIASLRQNAAAMAPAFAGLPLLDAWAGLRPISADQRPILGPDPDLAGLFYATGHGRNGILLGPLTAELVAAQITGAESAIDLRPYGIERFTHAPRPTPHAP